MLAVQTLRSGHIFCVNTTLILNLNLSWRARAGRGHARGGVPRGRRVGQRHRRQLLDPKPEPKLACTRRARTRARRRTARAPCRTMTLVTTTTKTSATWAARRGRATPPAAGTTFPSACLTNETCPGAGLKRAQLHRD